MKSEKQTATDASKKNGFLWILIGFFMAYGLSLYRPLTLYVNNLRNVLPLPFFATAGAYLLWIVVLYTVYYFFSRKIYAAVLLSLATHLLTVNYQVVQTFCAPVIPADGFLYAFIAAVVAQIVVALLLRKLSRPMALDVRRKLLVLLTVCLYGMLGALVITNLPSAKTVVPDNPVKTEVGPVNETVADEYRPNVYFILLDEYARADMVKKQFNYDNSAFMQFLQGQGFQLSLTSQNEIAYTDILASNMLSLDYATFIDSLTKNTRGYTRLDIDTRKGLYTNRTEYRNRSYLFDLMRSNHYKTYALDNTNKMFAWGTINADEVVEIPIPDEIKLVFSLTLTQNDLDYWLMLWQSSLLYQVSGTQSNMDSVFTAIYMKNQDIAWQNTLRNASLITGSFEYLQNWVPQENQPTFLYAHILCPHLPFIFYPDGSLKSMDLTYQGWTGERAYLDNYEYATRQITKVIEHLRQADPTAVIVLQSDHGARIDLTTAGPYVPDYLPILNAVYLPPEEDNVTIEGLSGVNTMRAVLGETLQIDLPPVVPPTYVKIQK